MSSKGKKILLISLLVIGLGAGIVLIWKNQPAEVTQEDVQTGNEIAEDEDLLNAIDMATSDEETTSPE